MAVNLHTRYAKEINTKFVRESLIAGKLDNTYSFSGVKTVKLSTPITVAMTDYTRSGTSRYGTPTEMQDVIQELTLSQDKSFALTIDKGNNVDQSGIKEAGKMLALQIAEQAVPTLDKYCFEQLSKRAGKIFGSSTALTKSNVCERITAGTTHMDDAEIPSDGRTLFVPSDTYAKLRLSDEFQKSEMLIDKSLAKGVVGTYDNMPVVKVPAARWPANVNFIIAHKRAATAPVKLNDTKFHQDPPGISGNLLEGRQYYDLFVFAAKCDGVYVDVNTTNGTIVATPSIAAATGVITCSTSGASVKYTTDGTDPRYSNTAKVGTTADVTASGTVVKAYAYKADCFPSAVAEQTLS